MHSEANLRCRQCGRKHNTILHVEEDVEHSVQEEPKEQPSPTKDARPARRKQQTFEVAHVETVGSCSAVSSEGSIKSGQTFFEVAPVKVWGPDPTKVEYT